MSSNAKKKGKQKDASNSFKNGKQPAEDLYIDDDWEDFQAPIKVGKRKHQVHRPQNTVSQHSSDDDFLPVVINKKVKSNASRTPSSSKEGITADLLRFASEDQYKLMTGRSISDDYNLDNDLDDDYERPTAKTPAVSKPSPFTSQKSLITLKSAPNPNNVATPAKPEPPSTKINAITSRIMVVKATIKKIWKNQYMQALYDLVNTTNVLVTHTYAFVKFIFIQEIRMNDFNVKNFIHKDFFVEVFLSLIQARVVKTPRLKETTQMYRRLINKYKHSYCEHAKYTPIPLVHAQQIAIYECTKIQTAFLNNIKAHFGNRLRAFVNIIFKKKEKAEDLRKNMKRNGNSEDNIKKALNKEVYQPCNNLREAIVQKKSPDENFLDSKSLIILKSFYTCYEEGYTFEKNSIYYDVQVRPENHFKAFYKIATVFEEVKKKPFICYPLRTTFIPCYITVDTKILHTHILRRTTPYKADAKMDTWGAVVKLNHPAFKDQLKDKSLQFKGTMETDGVGVSLIKQNFDTDRKGPQSNKKKQNNSSTVTASIDELDQEYLKKTEGKCVLIDPGRRDLLYCMKETSTASDKQIVVHTKINRNKLQRHYRSLRQKTKPEAVQNAETILSSAKSHSLKLENYVHYINTRATVNDVLQEYYGNETYNVGRNYYPDVRFIFWVKPSGDLYLGNTFITRRREWRSGIDGANYSQMFPTYLNLLIQQQHIFNRFKKEERAEINGIVLRMMVTREIGGLIERASQIIGKLQLLPFRKMKFSGKIFHDQNDAQLLEKMKAKFGKDFIIIIGNWSAPNIKFQEPTRNKGFIEMFKKNGFEAYLIDEFKTSSVCPVCESHLEKFKKIPNPRPFMRKKNPTVTCHGLLRCENAACLPGIRRLYNRDLAAVLNFKKILHYLRRTGQRHSLFSRKKSHS